MSTNQKPQDFKDKPKIGLITAVNPQAKTVDIRYLSQDGNYTGLSIPYMSVGLTWGIMSMPMKGDKVLLDNLEGDRPSITRTIPTNTDYLPYLDPGEVAMASENGSYMFARNRRKKVKSTGAVIAPDATKGPNGETDLELEPGGLVLRVRSKQTQDGFIPRFYSHSYIAMFDNGNVNIQSMYQGITKGLLYMDGSSGYVGLIAGNSTVQEYYEMDPVNQRIVEYSDGNKHQVIQADSKRVVFGNEIREVVGALEYKTGLNPLTIPTNFDTLIVDPDMTPGDIRFSNVGTVDGLGRFQLFIQGDVDIIVEVGNVNITTLVGDINATAAAGDVNLTSLAGAVNVTANGVVDITTDGDANITSAGIVQITAPVINLN